MARHPRNNARLARRPLGGSDGFTLVEALVALSLFALLTLFLFSGVRFGNRAVAMGGSKLERTAAVALAEGFLRAQLARAEPLTIPGATQPLTMPSVAQPLTIPGAAQRPVIAFDGEADRLDFVSLPPAYLSVGGLQWFRIALDGIEPHRRLIVQWQPIDPNGGAPDAFGNASVLLEGVASATFFYFSAGDRDHPAAWYESWKDAPALPDLISLRIVFADGEIAPELIVTPRLSATSASAH